MNIKEYITMYYPIKERITRLNMNTEERVREQDDLPYDCIGIDSYGKVCKMVIINEDDGTGRPYTLPVLEVLSLDREELVKSKESDLLTVYDNLMNEVEMSDINLCDLEELVRAYRTEKGRMEMLNSNVSSIC